MVVWLRDLVNGRRVDLLTQRGRERGRQRRRETGGGWVEVAFSHGSARIDVGGFRNARSEIGSRNDGEAVMSYANVHAVWCGGVGLCRVFLPSIHVPRSCQIGQWAISNPANEGKNDRVQGQTSIQMLDLISHGAAKNSVFKENWRPEKASLAPSREGGENDGVKAWRDAGGRG